MTVYAYQFKFFETIVVQLWFSNEKQLDNLRFKQEKKRISNFRNKQTKARLENNRVHSSQTRLSETKHQSVERRKTGRLRILRSRWSIHVDINWVAFHYDDHYKYSLHPNVVIGLIYKIWGYYDILKFNNKVPGMCCVDGNIKLPELHSPPEPLSTLLSNDTILLKHFLFNIRKYNSWFYMASFDATNIDCEKIKCQYSKCISKYIIVIHLMGNTEN